MKMIRVYLYCGVMLLLLVTTGNSATISYKGIKNSVKKINLDATFMASSNMYNPESTNYRVSSVTELAATYPFKRGEYLTLSVSATKDLGDYYEEELSSLDLVFGTRSYKVSKYTKYRGSLSMCRPLDEYSVEDATLNGSVGLGNSFVTDMKMIGLKNLKLTYGLSVTKNFHTYKVAYSGSSNTSHAVRNRVTLSYTGFSPVTISYGASVYQAYTYQNNRKDPSYSHGLTTSFAKKNYSASLKLSSGGNIYRPDGKTNDVAFFESDRATMLVALGVSI